MDGGHSISFTSFDSRNYPSHRDLTFHEIQPTDSRHSLAKDSTIRHFPGRQVNLGQNLEIMVLLQTAEIERLTSNLHEYRQKFRRILNNEKDFNSFRQQADELLQAKDELELKNRKIHQYAQSQKGELVDQFRYLQVLQSKYKRSLKLIEEAHLARQQIQQTNIQLRKQLTISEMAFETFKQKSVEEYQTIRQELERVKNDELSFEVNKFVSEKARFGQILKRQETKAALQRQKYESLLEQERNRIFVGQNEIQRLKCQVSETKSYSEELSLNYKKGEQEKENHFVLLGTQVQRLNFILKDKSTQIRELEIKIQELSNKLTQKEKEAQNLRRDQERFRHKSILYEDQINKQNQQIVKLSTNLSSFTNKINELGLLIEQKNVQLKLKDNKFAQQIQKYTQTLSKSEYHYNREVEEARLSTINIAKELERVKKESILKQESFSKRQAQIQAKLQESQSKRTQLNTAFSRQSSKVKLLEDKHSQQNGKLFKDVQALRKKVEELYQQNKTIEENYRKEQRQFMLKSSKVYEQNWEQMSSKYIESNQKLKQAIQSKQGLEKTIYSLKNSLQRSQIQRQQIKKCRTFESMIKQIQNLCESTHKKDGQIIQLKQVISNLQNETKNVKRQIESLQQVIVRLINMNNANESNRRQDNYLMIEQIKKLFIHHSIAIDEIKQSTHKIAYNYNKHKQFLESSQNHLVKSKELQIEDLKEKLNMSVRQTQSKDELKQIINKIITITKQNTQLKVTINKRSLQVENLSRQLQNMKRELNRTNQTAFINIRDKDQLCNKLLYQLQESNSLLFEEKQNQMKLQSSLIILEEEKDKNNKQVETRASIIKQLKNAIKAKDEQTHQLNLKIQQLQNSRSNLKRELNDLTEAKRNLQIINKQKQQLIRQLKQRNEKNQYNNRIKQGNFEKTQRQMVQKLAQSNEYANIQIPKLKNQVNTLISQNSQLKQQIIKTGSSILHLTQTNQYLQSFEGKCKNVMSQCQSYKRQINQLLQHLHEHQVIKYQYENIKLENQYTKRELQKAQKAILSSSEKIQILQKQLHRMERIVDDFKVQTSHLQSSNYQFSITIEKNKIFEQKILVLNEQIDRLQKERMNHIEELNICRLQMSQDCTLDRQMKQYQCLLVLLFAEVQSVRQLLSKKQQQITQLRKQNLR